MRIVLRNEDRRRLFTVDVNPADPPAMVRPPAGGEPAVSLDWDRAIDDERHLRHCPVCGCEHLFARKRMPQLTAFSLILLAAIVAMILFGYGQVRYAVLLFAIVLTVDAAVYFFSPRMLVCYRCRSEFTRLPIRKGHPGWDNNLGEKYRQARHRAEAAAVGSDKEAQQ